MMKKIWEKIAGAQIIRFGIVGVLNTLIGTCVMFFCYNVLHLGYWFSSAMNYVVGSIFSYFANKHFTFQSKDRSDGEIVRFIANISICYLIAYGIAEPLVRNLLEALSWNIEKNIYEQIAMVVGMGLFVVLNFIGQKLIVFKKRK